MLKGERVGEIGREVGAWGCVVWIFVTSFYIWKFEIACKMVDSGLFWYVGTFWEYLGVELLEVIVLKNLRNSLLFFGSSKWLIIKISF